MSQNILSEICQRKKEHIKKQKQSVSETLLLNEISRSPSPKGFIEAIRKKIERKENALIAEVKKASPSKGVIREQFNHIEIAKAYEKSGATCLSVLTDTPFFQGEDSYLRDISGVISLPLLRKDFMLDPYQVLEARAMGASCILLIMAALSDKQAIQLEATAIEYGLDVLVEVHDKNELERALEHLKSPLIGINNRNLKTLEVSLATTETLAKYIPKNHILVCESGIYSYDDIKRMNQCGAYTFLVGESLMRQKNIEEAVHSLLNT